MAIQSSVNALMQQLYNIGAISAGLREQKKQTAIDKAALPSYEERFRKEFKLDEKTPLTPEQKKAVEYGEFLEKKRGTVITPSEAWRRTQNFAKMNERRRSFMDAQSAAPAVRNEVARDLARSSVESRTDNLNQSKSDFEAHTASLIKEYGKGSGRP